MQATINVLEWMLGENTCCMSYFHECSHTHTQFASSIITTKQISQYQGTVCVCVCAHVHEIYWNQHEQSIFYKEEVPQQSRHYVLMRDFKGQDASCKWRWTGLVGIGIPDTLLNSYHPLHTYCLQLTVYFQVSLTHTHTHTHTHTFFHVTNHYKSTEDWTRHAYKSKGKTN